LPLKKAVLPVGRRQMAIYQSGRKKALWLWSGVFGRSSQPVAQADRRKPFGFQAKSLRGRLSFFVGFEVLKRLLQRYFFVLVGEVFEVCRAFYPGF